MWFRQEHNKLLKMIFLGFVDVHVNWELWFFGVWQERERSFYDFNDTRFGL